MKPNPTDHQILNLPATSSTDTIFREAYDQFLAVLPPKFQGIMQQCNSPQEVLEYVGQLAGNKFKNGRAVAKNISSLNDKLVPYLEVFGIFVSSNPQFAALIWGALRLVLQVIQMRKCLPSSLFWLNNR